ncbi:hypothetical protein ACJIZ3_010880 [Penstemon smallii]|uniref:RNase III domain-containing protein n=1 Tax=Penstemon smallii TaxID=265156 RepID=A0ABD3UKQ6_9LAMI
MEEEDELLLSIQLLLKENNEEEEKYSQENRVKAIKDITGYEFNDPIILQQAFTHHSYEEGNSSSYDRLEYIGDSVLNFLIAKEHFLMYPDLDPGKLTRLRSANVDTEKLARVSFKHELYKLLRHNHPHLDRQINEFRDAIKEYPLHSTGLIDTPKALADIVESLVGAIYIDSNSSIDITWEVVKNLLQPMITPENLQTHPVTMLNEMCQKKGLEVKFVDLWSAKGEIEVLVDGEFVGKGIYEDKKVIAVNRAARNAYIQIVEKLHQENIGHDPS